MHYQELQKDLFTVSEDYYLAHCISSDFVMGGGIAVPFNKKFDLKEQFRQIKKGLLVKLRAEHGTQPEMSVFFHWGICLKLKLRQAQTLQMFL